MSGAIHSVVRVLGVDPGLRLTGYACLDGRDGAVETPVLVEAAGPSYQEFGRVSMNTGLPIVLGWEYHVFQRSQSQVAAQVSRALSRGQRNR